MKAVAKRALLLVVSAPSGGGKTTLCDRLLADEPDMVYSVSCTTRPPRGDEADGRDYHFLAGGEFERRLAAGEFLEHAVVHGYKYGTLRKPVLNALRAGKDVLMDIDVQGAAQIRKAAVRGANKLLKQAFVDIFLVPPSMAALRERLEQRREDRPAIIERRLRAAAKEMKRWREYQYMIVNDQLEVAYQDLRAIVAAERCRNRRAAGRRGGQLLGGQTGNALVTRGWTEADGSA